ncbi:cytochrome P450 [Actinomadura sp. KC216]|uniref:cytochrome P450 n=1 Tax=Actinomadura sp. KC216 TaxID=2530370 RepID=UPI0010438290|nr:cytochrome P450 [Actinomadura sp. KC216]TDB85808.1 cytochrome P450 [Actinomadura sp. KC216]
MTDSLTAASPETEARLMAFFDPANRADPYPILNALREASPFTWMDGGLVVLGRHRHVVEVLKHPDASVDRTKSRLGDPEAIKSRGKVLSFLDPPDHTRVRRLVSKAFTPRVISRMEPRVHEMADELLTAVRDRDRGGLELIEDFAYPLPIRMIAEMLAVPTKDLDTFMAWSDILAQGLDPAVAAERTEEAVAEDLATRKAFNDYFRRQIAERRNSDADDLLTRLVQIEESGDQLSEEELLSICVVLMVAGHETTTTLIANSLLALLRHPDQLAAARKDPALMPSVVEEVLRWDPPVHLTHRVAKATMEFDDLTIPEGTDILLLLSAANRDPDVFTDPDRFDIERSEQSRLDHLAFSIGPHFCFGASMGRMEAQIAVSAVLDRCADLAVDRDDLPYRPHVILRRPERVAMSYSTMR